MTNHQPGWRAIVCAAAALLGLGASTSSLAVGTTSSKTTLASNQATPYVNQSVTLTATVAPTSGTGATPTGTVTFKDGTTAIAACPGTLASGVATCTTKFTTAGVHTIAASYGGDATYQTSAGTSVIETVKAQYTTSTTLSSSASTATVGQSVTLTSKVTSSGSGVIPTGTVTFLSGTYAIAASTCPGTLNASATATCTLPFTTSGSRSLTAVYNGDTANLASSPSPAVAQNVNPVTAGVTLTPSANPLTVSHALTLVATVNGYLPTGPVQFKDGSSNLGGTVQLNNGQASITFTPTAIAGHVYGASYAGDPGNSAASAQTIVNVAGANSTLALTASTNTAKPTTSVAFTATVSGASPTGSVTFRDGATPLGTISLVGGVATLNTTLADGPHTVAVSYGGDSTNAPCMSGSVLVQVSDAGTLAPATAAMQWNYEYDALGNLTKVTDANTAITQQAYDSLSRNTKITQPSPTAPSQPGPVIGLSYDLQDQTAQVTDPRTLTTSYTTDGLGNTSTQASPDTGTTTRTFYDNGLLHTSKDANGHTATYTYDALNRVTTISYDGVASSTFTYDQGTFGQGELTTVADESGSTVYTYDGFGRVLTRTQTTGPSNKVFKLVYTWGSTGTATGKLQTVTYPSGAVVTYGYDAAGRVNDVGVTGADGVVTKVLTGLGYTALNQPKSWIWGTGAVVYQRGFDGYGRLARYPLGNPNGSGASAGVMRAISFDAAGRIVGYAHTTAVNWNQVFSYDGLDRLTSANLTNGNTYGYAYDATGNRTQATINGTSYTSTVSTTSNWYTTVATASGTNTQTYDSDGHVKAETQGGTYTYSARGRLSSEVRAGNTFNYLYNAFEQRVYKNGPTSSPATPTGAVYYAYDQAGHLVGEYDSTGKAVYETVYLGDIPVAALTQAAIGKTTVSYIYADHLNTARVIVRPADQAILWQWGSNEPFGQSQANSNPNNLGVFTYNPRFPGQVADAESGWFYNWHRDYDPAKGRYAESDPLGLGGGISTYAYSSNTPFSIVDPQGLAGVAIAGPLPVYIPQEAIPGTPQNQKLVGNTYDVFKALQQSLTQGMAANSSRPAQKNQTSPAACPQNPPPDCDELEQRVRDAKDWMGKTYTKNVNPSVCNPGMSEQQLIQRVADWLTLAQSRAHRDQKCYGGGDENHQIEQATAWQQLGNCQRLLWGN